MVRRNYFSAVILDGRAQCVPLTSDICGRSYNSITGGWGLPLDNVGGKNACGEMEQ